MSDAWLAVALVLLVLAASMRALSCAPLRRRFPVEAGRKLLHVQMGLATAAFPWLFASAWPVVALAGLSIAWFALLRASPRLAGAFGAPLYDCERRSAGEIWFVLGVCLTFLATAGDRLAYCVAILVMTLADAAAALVGRRFGRSLRLPGGARKSLAGSAAFFGVAFLVASVISWAAGFSPAEALRAGFAVALLTTVVEALLGDGLDNLAVPLAAALTLKVFT